LPRAKATDPISTLEEIAVSVDSRGQTFESHRGGSGHLTVYLNGRKTQLPMHGKKDLGTGLVRKIRRDLGLKD
jgi:mRNA interferase HicA